ncbi:hypothetical protein BD414DRAFT_535764 [Trametes punicea]|nr:hypothetical protein BD414DRAFT_535764 [Trametes punicea]
MKRTVFPSDTIPNDAILLTRRDAWTLVEPCLSPRYDEDSSPGCSRPELPLEIYNCIFTFFNAERSSGLETLLSALSTSYLRTAAYASNICKPYYDALHKDSVPEDGQGRREQYGDDYRLPYFARRELDCQTLGLLDEIRKDIAERNAKACVVVKGFPFDIWDALCFERWLPIPRYFRSCGSSKEPASHALPRRSWAGVTHGVISRFSGFSAFYDWALLEPPNYSATARTSTSSGVWSRQASPRIWPPARSSPLPAVVFFNEAVQNVNHDLQRSNDNEIRLWNDEEVLLAAHAMHCAVAICRNVEADSFLIFSECMAEAFSPDGGRS